MPNIENGFKAYASYDSTKLDTVNLANGGLTLHIPLPFSYPQRGGKLDQSYFLVSNSKHWQVQYYINSNDYNYYWDYGSGPYAKYAVPPVPYLSGTLPIALFRTFVTEVDSFGSVSQWDGGYYLQAWDGSVHQLQDLSGNRTSFESSDTSGFHLAATNSMPDGSGFGDNFVLTDRNGNVYQGTKFVASTAPACTKAGGTLPGSMTTTTCPQITRFQTITDVNGNILSTTDTLGRSGPLSATSSTDVTGCATSLAPTSSVFYSYTGPSGTTEQIKICYGSLTMQTNFSQSGVGQFPLGGHTSPNPVSVITTMILPNNTKWTLSYDSYGEVLNVGLPTGGSISYTWTEISFPSCDSTKVSRAVASRTLNDSITSSTWNYSWGAPQPDGTLTNSVTDPLGNDTVHILSPIVIGCNFYETSTKSYQGTKTTGQLLRQVDTTYLGGASGNDGTLASGGWAVPITITTTDVPSGKVTLVQKTYDPGLGAGKPIFGEVASEKVYDWGTGAQGPLLRETDTTYVFQNDSRYTTANLITLPAAVITKDGSGTRVAETDYAYDDPARLTSANITIQHGTAPNPSPVRGNATSASKWLNTSANPIISYTNWYDTGVVYKSIDPLNHTTIFAYSGTFVGAYPTTVTNALTQSATYNYDFSTGLLTSATDLNNLPTTYSYDSMFRLSQVNGPEGSQGTLTRQESASPFSTTLTTKINSTQNLVKTNVLDGLGRLKQSQFNSTFTDTTYDGLGRVHSVSNPHLTGSSSTDGTTTYVYDPLDRTCVVVPPDGTAVSGSTCPATQPANDVFTTYSGNTTTVTDQAGKSRKSVHDGLGRLTQVFEDPGSSPHLNYETDYLYDTLDDLTCAVQKGSDTTAFTTCAAAPATWRARSFTYNSLSQLTQAVNPESGAINYTYNSDGTLATKISPAPNQTGAATVTATYSYDALQRMTQKSFSDTTPTVKYGYDAVVPAGCTLPTLTINNGIGKRTGMCDAAGAEAWSYDITANVGWKITDARTTNGVTKSTVVQNNLAGSAATLTYPSGRVITYSFDAAARPISAIDSTGPINYATAATYAPNGALSSLANGASLNSTLFYNSRLQPCRISVKFSGTVPTSCSDASNTGNVLDFAYNFSLGTMDNGNVTAITNNRDTTRSQNFSYDSLNRLSTAQTRTIGVTLPNSNCWGLTFGYDPWGNFLQQNVTGPAGCSEPLPLNVVATNANRISTNTVAGVATNYCYDAVGNLIHTVAAPATCPASGPYQYTYNAENQVTSTAGVTYTYDGDGKRVQKSNGKLYWYGMGSDPLDETDLTGAITNAAFHEFIFFGGKRIARRDSSNNVNYYFADHLGTARVSTNASGSICYDADFYPFGGERIVADTCDSTYKFTGKERDTESGLDNFGARYDASSLGRFMTPDPLMASATVYNPQTWNRYTYALNNPLRFVDPDGMKELSAEDCKKDANCVALKVNIIYDANANDGKGLTDQQKQDFQNQQLQNAKDQYGNADIHLDVTFTAGGFDDKGNLQGAVKDSVNVLVTDSGPVGVSGMTNNGYALTKINVNRSDKETLAHELAHDFMGDTTGLISQINPKYDAGISNLIGNMITDVINDTQRAQLTDQHSQYVKWPCTGCNLFNMGARQFQDKLTQQAAIRPRQ
jgi:RHS repeat-associated protein